MRLSLSLHACVLSILLSLGCGSSGGGGSSTNSVALAELSGEWELSCFANVEYSVKVSGSDWETTASHYSSSCTSHDYDIVLTSKIDSAGSAVTGGKSIDLSTPSEATLVIQNASGVSRANSSSFCSRTNWSIGTHSINSTNCSDLVSPSSKCFSIYEVSGSSLKVGTQSGSNDCSSEAKRHTTLSGESYTKL